MSRKIYFGMVKNLETGDVETQINLKEAERGDLADLLLGIEDFRDYILEQHNELPKSWDIEEDSQ